MLLLIGTGGTRAGTPEQWVEFLIRVHGCVPISFQPKLGLINSTTQDPPGRYNAAMAPPDLFTVEPVKVHALLTQN